MKLREIQQKLVCPKGQFNTYGDFAYRSCEDILEAVKPLLEDSLLVLTDEVIHVGDFNYVKATALFKEKDAEPYMVTAYAREAETKKGMDPSQMTGTASSYARKYALNGLFLIDDVKDADTDADTKKRRTTKASDGVNEVNYDKSSNQAGTDADWGM